MPVPVMDLRHVRMIMHEVRVMVLVAVWLARRVTGAMNMLMVLVVHVEVRMRHLFVLVQV